MFLKGILFPTVTLDAREITPTGSLVVVLQLSTISRLEIILVYNAACRNHRPFKILYWVLNHFHTVCFLGGGKFLTCV